MAEEPSPLERELLSLGTEDWYHLWSALDDPALAEPEILELTKETLRSMVNRGLLKVCLVDMATNTEVPTSETVDDLIDDAESWVPGARYSPEVCFTATEHGEQVYFALPWLD